MQVGNRKVTIAATAAVCLLLLATGATSWFLYRDGHPEEHNDAADFMTAISRPPIVEETHLYNGYIDGATGKYLVDQDRGKLFGHMEDGHFVVTDAMTQNKDGSLLLTKLVPEMIGALLHRKLSSKEYYPTGEGEEFRRLHNQLTFGPDGFRLDKEEVFHLDGTTERSGYRHDDGSYDLVTFYEDGETIKLKRLTPPNADTAEPLREEQFRPKSEGNYLLSSNILNDDGTRTLTEYSTRRNYPWKITHTGSYGHQVGTTIRAWYPGTDKMRLDAEVTMAGTRAEFYRQDGTRFRKLRLGLYAHEDVFFGADGKTVLYEQWWDTRRTIGKHKVKIDDRLEKLIDSDGKGGTRVFYFDRDTARVKSLVRLNALEGGQRYQKIESTIRIEGTPAEIGTVTKTEYTRTAGGPTTVKEFTAAQNVRIEPPKDELAPPDFSDELPSPPPTRMGPR